MRNAKNRLAIRFTWQNEPALFELPQYCCLMSLQSAHRIHQEHCCENLKGNGMEVAGKAASKLFFFTQPNKKCLVVALDEVEV